MRFAPHTALPRVKGMHQPRDSAVFFSKQTATATAGGRRAGVEQAGTDGEGRSREGGSSFCPPPTPPACVSLLAGVPPDPPPPPPGGGGQGEVRQTAAGGGRVSQPHQLSGIARPIPTPTTPLSHASPYHMAPSNPGVGSGCSRPLSPIAGVSLAVL